MIIGIEVVLRDPEAVPTVAELLDRVCERPPEVDHGGRRLSAPVQHRVAALGDVLRGLEQHGIEAEDVALRRPTLDDVFLHLTGRRPA